MAARAYWKGYLKLALVSCPVKLFKAVSTSEKISFNQLHKDTLNRVNMKYHDPEIGEVERTDLVKGYQFEKDRYIVVSKEELDAIQIESNKTIDIEGFVDASDIDTRYMDAPYYLGPDGPVAEETFAVISKAMAKTGKIGIGRIVLSGRERMVALGAKEGGVVLTTLRSGKEVREMSAFVDAHDLEVDAGLLDMAETIIAGKSMEFDPAGFEDRYEQALLELVKAKIAGEEPVISTAPEQGKVVNLMDALKASIEEERRPAAASKAKSPAAQKPATSTAKKTATASTDGSAPDKKPAKAKSAAAAAPRKSRAKKTAEGG